MDQPHRASAPHTPQEHPPRNRAGVSSAGRSHRASADLKAYLDGELPAWKRGLLARHLRRCAPCRAETQALERLGRHAQNLARMDQAVPRPQLRARILANLPDAAPARPAPKQTKPSFASMLRKPQWAMGSLCAALLLFLFGSAYALNHWKQAGATNSNASNLAANTASSDRQAGSVNGGKVSQNGSVAGPIEQVIAAAPVRPNAGDPFSPSVAVGETMFPNAAHSSTPGAAGHSSDSSLETRPTADAAGVPPAETYHDPISREAERLAAQPIVEKLREKQHEKEQLAAAKTTPARSDTRLAMVKSSVATGTQLAFAVADVLQARIQVQKWAAAAGVEMTVLADTAPQVDGSASASSGPSGNALDGKANAPALLKLKVPAQCAESFKSCLSQVGTPLPAGSPRKDGERVRALMTEEIAPRAWGQSLPAFTPGKAAGGEAKRTFTVVLRLQAGPRQDK